MPLAGIPPPPPRSQLLGIFPVEWWNSTSQTQGTARNHEASSFVNHAVIYKAAGLTVCSHGFYWYNFSGTEKCPLAVNGSHQQECCPENIPAGGTQSGGLVNSAVNVLDIVPLPRFFLDTSRMNQHNSDFALSAFLIQY